MPAEKHNMSTPTKSPGAKRGPGQLPGNQPVPEDQDDDLYRQLNFEDDPESPDEKTPGEASLEAMRAKAELPQQQPML